MKYKVLISDAMYFCLQRRRFEHHSARWSGWRMLQLGGCRVVDFRGPDGNIQSVFGKKCKGWWRRWGSPIKPSKEKGRGRGDATGWNFQGYPSPQLFL
jgi:hypothetical protein